MIRPLKMVCLALAGSLPMVVGCAGVPRDNPAAALAPWTGEIAWGNAVNIADVEAKTLDARFDRAQAMVAGQGGGVVYFPAGVYEFHDTLRLLDGVVIRGATPRGETDARKEGYAPPTRFVFPRFVPVLEGEGTPIETAFKGIELAEPATASNVGVVNVSLERGHIYFGEGADHASGRNRLVMGCVLRNAAIATGEVPDVSMGQHPWQRFTAWHRSAIHLYTGANALVANNRLPRSGEENFLQKGYLILGRGRDAAMMAPEPGVMFDYDNRGGISINMYTLGGGGGVDPKGTPETVPEGFRKGIVIRGNYIYSTGRSAIGFSGDGTICNDNVIRFPKDLRRYTNTGRNLVAGSSTNGNRAMVVRGWRWHIEGNDYIVYRNLAADSGYYINDGEGIMHEGHANSTIRDSQLIHNRGNAYLSLFKTAGIDGLLIRGNEISSPGISAIYVNSDRNWDRHLIRNVTIEDNITDGGILISGSPAENNVVRNNRELGKEADLINAGEAKLEGNVNYRVMVPEWKPR